MNVKSGTRPSRHDHRDYDWFKTKRLQGIIPAYPDNYSTDASLWMPDQKADGQPYGCTNYAQSDLLTDEDRKLFNPLDLEAITHANANGGTDLRTSLKAVLKLHPDHPAFFNVQPDIQKGGNLDWFDAIRVAILVGQNENRAVSVGTPWFPEFEDPVNGFIPDFLDWDVSRASWHNWCVKGWIQVQGVPYLISKSWQGPNYGAHGYVYFSRAQFNRLMAIPGTAAYVLDKLRDGEQPITVSSTVKQWLVSFFSNLFSHVGLAI